ncbi:MAG: glycolate oxidase subunit GlcE [Halioglobus sp.]
MSEPALQRDADCETALVAALQAAREAKRPLYVRGGDSKRDVLGRACEAAPLDVAAHRGILDYQPGELVISARAGTSVAAIQAALDEHRHMLPSEPPLFGGSATIGGTLACNLSGPGRPWRGATRDSVLGVKLLNGKGELLNFGGRVMKNVAGYDVSRLQAGAMGTLGVLCEITLRVVPQPEHSVTLGFELPAAQALTMMLQRAAQPAPLSAACWVDGRLHLRLSGAASAVRSTAQQWGGEPVADANDLWASLREMTHPFFSGDAPLWRLSLNSAAAVDNGEETLIDWGGAQRWLRAPHNAGAMHAKARAGGGHACLFRGGDRSGEVRAPLPEAQQRVQQKLKHAFDPDGLLNPGRLYSWL